MIWLLDGNVLTALAIDSHVHHERALAWFNAMPRSFATCTITEGTLLRLHMQFAEDTSAEAAWKTLELLQKVKGYEFWEDGFSYSSVPHQRLTNHRQVTDAWLAQLARSRGQRLATLDIGLVKQQSDVAELVP